MSIQGGQPQRVLMSQGEVRPGVVQGQHWVLRTWWEQCPIDRLPYTRGSVFDPSSTRPTPARRPNPRLSNRMLR